MFRQSGPNITTWSLPRAFDDRTTGGGQIHPVSTIETRVAFEDALVRVEANRVRNAATQAEETALRIAPASDALHMVAIVPVLDDGRFLLVGRYRYALARWSLEFPRFWAQSSDAGWEHAAAEILFKSTGLTADQMRLLGAIEVEPSLTSISMIVIHAADCGGLPAKPAAGSEESLIAGCVALAADEMDALMLRGEVSCSATLSALSLYRAQPPQLQ
jgi:hypothetical protein